MQWEPIYLYCYKSYHIGPFLNTAAVTAYTVFAYSKVALVNQVYLGTWYI